MMDALKTVQTNSHGFGKLVYSENNTETPNFLFFFLLLLFTKYQHKYRRGGCVILLCVDVCVRNRGAGREVSTETNAPPLCSKHTAAFREKVTFVLHILQTEKSKDMACSGIKITLNKTNQNDKILRYKSS